MVLYADGVKDGRARKVGAVPGKPPLTHTCIHSALMQPAQMDKLALREDVNEALLFHGTSEAAAEAITNEDFRINLSGKNAGTLYGRGIYLAESCSKSDEYTEENAEGLRCLLLCRLA